jgi:flagellar biosynthesis/type III secretory pathway M-ring protein FliF/YscJ
MLLSRFRGASEEELRELIGKRVNVVLQDGVTPEMLAEGVAHAELSTAQQKQLTAAGDLASDAAKLREERQREIAEYITRKPHEAGRLLKVWLAES